MNLRHLSWNVTERTSVGKKSLYEEQEEMEEKGGDEKGAGGNRDYICPSL